MAQVVSQSLVWRNSLAVEATASAWCDWQSIDELQALHQRYASMPVLAYGEGTNMLLAGNPTELCVHAQNQTLRYSESDSAVELTVGAGVHWNWLVHHCLANGWWGLENLVAIPGSCGAAPVQNIGAYGLELADRCCQVVCFDWTAGKEVVLAPQECEFSYRNSIFKRQPNLIITHIVVQLTSSLDEWRQWQEQGVHHNAFANMDEHTRWQPRQLAAAIVAIRRRKLPDYLKFPNAGSFFHNPIVNYQDHAVLVDRALEHAAAWYVDTTKVKLSAAWLIDTVFGKGYTYKACGLAPTHALCVINKKGASGKEIWEFAEFIRAGITQRFGVDLAIEPKVVGNMH